VEIDDRSYDVFKRLRALTVLFYAKPQIAHQIRRFTLRQEHLYNDNANIHHSTRSSTREVRDILKEAISANSHSAEEVSEWMIHAVANDPDALLALLLPAMPRLEELDLTLRLDYLYFDRMLTRAIAKKKPFDKQPLFPALTDFMHVASVHYRFGACHFNHHPMSSQYGLWFQNFPCIRSIFGHRVFDSRNSPRGMNSDSYLASTDLSSPLTYLELKSSCIEEQNLCTILKIPKALQTFIYEIYPKDIHMSPIPMSASDRLMGTVPISALHILSALEPRRNSLQNLWIGSLDDEEYSRPYDKHKPSLTNFNKLKNLRLAAEVLDIFLYPDHNGMPSRQNCSGLFPATLETLHII
jgi:hypothetical protein